MATPALSENDFPAEVLESDVPVLVDFWAPWCGPCRMLGPVVDQIHEENGGTVKVFKVNVDENPSLSQNFQITSIPTMFIFSDGNVAEILKGVVPKDVIQDKLDNVLQAA